MNNTHQQPHTADAGAAQAASLPAYQQIKLALDAGQTHLNSEGLQEVGMIPTGVELFALDTALFGFLPP